MQAITIFLCPLLVATACASFTPNGTVVGGAREFHVTIKDGKVVGGPSTHKARKGDKVAIVVTSDVADEVHLHGYDVDEDVDAGGTVRLEVKATRTGSFELELESDKLDLGPLQVR